MGEENYTPYKNPELVSDVNFTDLLPIEMYLIGYKSPDSS